ncbi:hypothetical protein BDQ94DRAFT_58800 [Aspergillus welwitschiae]|uniref:Uncharacterized protein n=1 Tax=Aspergillus welwitschiae TaxID=1341132 RepID=A0A3F3PXG4_9EURO|nr:hypothetical protein BDQ94DRAFT_58800 [Aspergillus welwitschiae]RDH31575.1 hypothetical protein BDQ94DRAFT_58800 [Aspergillus welwitschiae]
MCMFRTRRRMTFDAGAAFFFSEGTSAGVCFKGVKLNNNLNSKRSSAYFFLLLCRSTSRAGPVGRRWRDVR